MKVSEARHHIQRALADKKALEEVTLSVTTNHKNYKDLKTQKKAANSAS